MAKQLHVCIIKKSYVKLNTKQSITMARMNPKGVLGGEKPRLIDEWQKAPDIWNQVKDDLDFEYQFGKYILTGSSTPADKTEVHHSGAGRITPVKMRPMSLWESKESKGTISLMDLFDGKNNYKYRRNQHKRIDVESTCNAFCQYIDFIQLKSGLSVLPSHNCINDQAKN